MDQKTKSILIIIGLVLVAAIALYWIFKFWWTFVVAALAFGIGYFVGRSGKGGKNKVGQSSQPSVISYQQSAISYQ